MKALYRAVLVASGALALCAAQAQPSTPPEGSQPAPPADAPKPEPTPPQRSTWEGALGLLLERKPAFSGSSEMKLKPNLAGFVRWDRITITGAGGFTTRVQDDVERGIDAEIVRRGKLKMNLSLRFDGGRDESNSGQLAGVGDVKPTVRARLGARWDFAPRWQLSVAASGDILGKNGGMTTTAGLSHTLPIDARQRVIFGVGITAGNARYMQTWYGITPEQSAASGYPVYQPGTGLRDIGVTATWRIDFDRDWAGFAGVAQGYLLGPAADSPLALKRSGTVISGGLVRRF
jgi:outer membrane scaffolding protein for murein synthesis (MipA/OmpV family)